MIRHLETVISFQTVEVVNNSSSSNLGEDLMRAHSNMMIVNKIKSLGSSLLLQSRALSRRASYLGKDQVVESI